MILENLIISSGLEIYFMIRNYRLFCIIKYLEVIFMNLARKTLKLLGHSKSLAGHITKVSVYTIETNVVDFLFKVIPSY